MNVFCFRKGFSLDLTDITASYTLLKHVARRDTIAEPPVDFHSEFLPSSLMMSDSRPAGSMTAVVGRGSNPILGIRNGVKLPLELENEIYFVALLLS